MRYRILVSILIGITSFLVGCKQRPFEKEDILCHWEAVELNNEPLKKEGFTSVRMYISPDSIRVTTELKTVGTITTVSMGTWELKNKTFVSKIGEGYRKSRIEFVGEHLKFSPDPLFIYKSQYRKTE